MTQPVVGFVGGQPVKVRLNAEVRTALNAPDQDIDLLSLAWQGGMLVADFQDSPTQITRYLLPPQSILYARQTIDQGPAPQAPQQG